MGNYGIFLIMGNSGFISSTVFLGSDAAVGVARGVESLLIEDSPKRACNNSSKTRSSPLNELNSDGESRKSRVWCLRLGKSCVSMPLHAQASER